MSRFTPTPDGDVLDTWTGEGCDLDPPRREKPPLVIDRRHLQPITSREARALADLFGATVIYREAVEDKA